MKKKILFIFILFSIFFIPRVVVATSSVDRVHFIKNDSGSGDAIVIESNGHFGLVDTMSPGPTSPLAFMNNSLVNNVDNGTKVYNYLKKIGCTYLDFVIITHNHADHAGGISELEELVTSDTIVFYKEDMTTSDDVEELVGMDNHRVYTQMMEYITNHNAIARDISVKSFNNTGNSYISNIILSDEETDKDKDGEVDSDYNWLRKNYNFQFGDFTINMYNLGLISYHNENLNSIVTTVTNRISDKKIALMGDMETGRGDIDYDYVTTASQIIENPVGICEDCVAKGLENQLATIIGRVDILKAANNGRDTSNSINMLNLMNPKTYIIPGVYIEENGNISPQESNVASVYYLKKNYNSSYYTEQSDGAIVAEFNGMGNYSLANYSSETGSQVGGVSELGLYRSPSFNTDWFSLNGVTNRKKEWFYLEGNHLHTGWEEIDGSKYYFDTGGKMAQGFEKIEIEQNVSYYYYFYETAVADANHKVGSLATGLVKAANGDIFYLRETGEMGAYLGAASSGKKTINGNNYYFRVSAGQYSDGTIYSAVKGLVNWSKDKYSYFRTTDNEISEGPEATMIKSECVKVGKKRYCFDENGNVTSITTFVEKPTDEMCNSLRYTGNSQVLTSEALNGYQWVNNTATDVGNYQVTAQLLTDYVWDDDSSTPATITCEIKRKQVPKPTLHTDTFDYTGEEYTILLNDFDDTLMTKNGPENRRNAGNYSLTISLDDTTTTEWEDETDTDLILNWRIKKAYIPWPTLVSYTGNYDGKSHTIRVEPISLGTLQYKTDDTEWSSTNPSRTDAGTTTVYVKILGDNNHEDSPVNTATITINKVPAEPPLVHSYVGLVDGNPHTISVEPIENATIYYKTDDTEWSTEKPWRTDLGETTVYIKVTGDKNHTESNPITAVIKLMNEVSYYIENYTVDEDAKMITGISAGTTPQAFKENIIVGDSYSVVVDAHPTTGKVYTGGKLKIMQGSTVIATYTIVVTGDPSGDGLVNSADLLKIVKHLKETDFLLETYLYAADCTHDNNINSADLLKIVKYLKGIETL